MSTPFAVPTPPALTDAERQTVARVVDRALRVELTKIRGALAHDRDALHLQLQCVCGQASAMGIRAEQVLVAIKELWQQLPRAQSHGNGFDDASREGAVIREMVAVFYEMQEGAAVKNP